MNSKPIVLLFSLLTLFSCNDSDSFNPDDNYFKASAFVEVVDPNGNPVRDAVIATLHDKNGSLITDTYGTTNVDGVLQLNDAEFFSTTYITVTKPGFFKGSRRFYPTKDKTHYVHIVLMEKRNRGNFQANTGGVIGVYDEFTLEVPSDVIVDASGHDYDGTVNVLAQAIPADDENLSTKMPGDLVGYNDHFEKVVLGSLGMVAVELVTPSGDILKIKDGSKVKLKINVPSSKLTNAPSTIPMWYFDEMQGYWKQEGSAELVGNEYITEVSHFSFWNCDAWFDLVKWGATFFYSNGQPASQLTVCLTILSLNTGSCSSTNEDGFISGAVAANEVMLLEVRNPCSEVIYSQQIGPYADSTIIGPITIPGGSVDFVQVSGAVVDCNANPVTDGFASVQIGNLKYYQTLDETTGGFSLKSLNCIDGNIKVTAYDVTSLKQSLTTSFPFSAVIDAGTIVACEDLTEFIDIEAVGIPQHFYFYFPYASVQSGTSLSDSLYGGYIDIYIPGTTIGTYINAESAIVIGLPNGDIAVSNGVITVVITYFGETGDYITGTFTGTFHTGPNGQGGPDYPLQASFNIIRE